jgi:hypothetical protein
MRILLSLWKISARRPGADPTDPILSRRGSLLSQPRRRIRPSVGSGLPIILFSSRTTIVKMEFDDADRAYGSALTGDLPKVAYLTSANTQPIDAPSRRRSFLLGVFFISCAILVLQITQTRILSVVAWYYLAFFAISVAMLGMTIGAVWVYLKRRSFTPDRLATAVSDAALASAVAMPASLAVQFTLITKLLPTVASAVAWSWLMAAMTVPYIFAGTAVTLALTRSPFQCRGSMEWI